VSAACARCGEDRRIVARWPEGPICNSCYNKAKWKQGTCAGCGCLRQLPGRDAAGSALCVDCAGLDLDLICANCGTESYLPAGHRCPRCLLGDRLTFLLGDGDGFSQALGPLAEALLSGPSPWSTLQRLRKPETAELLREIATGSLPLTHAAFDQLPSSAPVRHLRDLLAAHGLLPPYSRELAGFERWAAAKLADIADAEHRATIKSFLAWNYLPRFRAAAESGLRFGEVLAARQSVTVAVEFLEWLAAGGRGLGDLRQGDLEEWLSAPPTTRWQVHAFVVWAVDSRLAKGVRMPAHHFGQREQLTQAMRVDLIRRLFYDDAAPLGVRVAGLLLLLYAQPVTAIVRLQTTDVRPGPHVLIRLGHDHVPVPRPFDRLLAELLAQTNTSSIWHPATRWLFPGRVPGQPVSAQALRVRLKALGVPVRAGKNSALAALVTELAAPLVAEAIGIHASTANRWASQNGAGWHRYARRSIGFASVGPANSGRIGRSISP
jgi:hypothetical protein